MDYEKAYKEAIKRAKAMIEVAEKEEVYKSAITIFPELKESDDERIRKTLIDYFNTCHGDYYGELKCKDILAWLEKQKVIDVLDEEEREFADNIDSFRKEIDAAHQKGYNEGVRVTLEKQGEKNSIMNVPSREVILSIWDLGNEWKELTNCVISTKYETQLDYIQKHWHESEYYLKAKQGEQKLPIEKLPEEMKTIGESLGFTTQEECDKYNQMVTDLIMSDDGKGEQKPADTVEPKFKVGDWVVQENIGVYKVIEVCESWYEVIDGEDNHYSISFDNEYMCHLWDITKDAKDGDVLAESKGDVILMFRGIGNARWDDIIDYHFYYDCYRENFIVQEDVNYWGNTENNQLKPATKEQRDLLFSKMKEAGYEWDAEKKELNKMHVIDEGKAEMDYCFTKMMNGERVSPAWSEEDERTYKSIMYSFAHNYPLTIQQQEFVKSLKHQNRWEPSEEQMKALDNALSLAKNCGEENAFDLRTLYEQLKKLMEE